ncbi:hypothetical protein IL306_013994 [Fusarium sp. DS 682]|nr:hypothetical protein IL306_013994 [Fusarium sp. DS 682]
MSPPALPTKLVTIPWCESLNIEAYSRKPEPSPEPFSLTVPHAIIRNTHLYNQLRYSEELDNRSLKDIIDPLCEEIAHYQTHDKNEMHGLSKTIVIKYGETSLRVIRRIWDLNLVYSSRPEIPGDLPTTFARGTWAGTLRDTVLYRMHYAEDFKIANHDQVKQGVYITDVLTRDHDDRVERAAKEREVLSAVWEEINSDSIFQVPSASTLGMTYSSALLNIAARAAANWEPLQPGSSVNVLAMYCEDMLRRRRNYIRKQNEELRKQLEAILGDTHSRQVGIKSASESEYDSDDESEEPEEPEEPQEFDESGLPEFDHFANKRY